MASQPSTDMTTLPCTASYHAANSWTAYPMYGSVGGPVVYVMRATRDSDGQVVYWNTFFPDYFATATGMTGTFSNVIVSNVNYWQQWSTK